MSEESHKVADQILLFSLDGNSYAFFLSGVIRIIHVVEIRPLPEAPEIVTGIINVSGRIIPVVDIRKRLGLPIADIDPDNNIIIADTGRREIGILVDSVSGLGFVEQGTINLTNDLLPIGGLTRGVAKVDDDLVLIYDLEKFLSLSEENTLDCAMSINLNES